MRRHLYKLVPVAMALILCLRPAIGFCAPSSVFVMPFENKTGDPSLDWLSLGLQDAMTIDLWQSGVVLASTISEGLKQSGMDIKGLSRLQAKDTLVLGKTLGVDQVWKGEYQKAQDGGLNVEIIGVDVNSGDEVFSESASAQTGELLSVLSGLTINILDTLDHKLGDDRVSMLKADKTHSEKVFRLNALGYSVQQELGSLDRRDRRAKYEKWSELLNGAVQEDPRYAEAWVNLGWAYYTMQQPALARQAFQKALEIKPYLLDANMGMGYVLRDAGDSGQAIGYFQKAVELNPNLAWPRAELEKTSFESATKEGLPYLIKMASEGDQSKRIKAIEKLGWFQEPEVKALLETLSRDNDEALAIAAMTSLSRSDKERAKVALRERFDREVKSWDLVLLAEVIDYQAAVPYIIETLRNKKSDYREAAVRFLGKHKVADGVPVLAEAIKQGYPLCIEAMDAINAIVDPAVIPVLMDTLSDERTDIRSYAISILGDREIRESIPNFWTIAYNDKVERIRVTALIALSYMGEEGAMTELASVIRGKNKKLSKYAAGLVKRKASKFKNTPLGSVVGTN